MATYEEIYGKRVKEFDSDPTLDDTYEGQVWYDKSSGVLKTLVKAAVVSTAATMPEAKRAYGSVGSTSEAFIAATGANPGTNYSTTAIEYNGSSWSGIPALTYSRDSSNKGALGTTSAGIVFGGLAPTIRANTELWNGSSWSESGDLSDSRGGGQAFGTQTACVTTGGYNEYSPPYWTNVTEEFDGSSWTSGTATPLNTINGCGCGISTAGMIVGQQEQPSNSYPSKASVTQTRNYDGSAWTNGGVINMATAANATVGTQSAARKAGGSSPAPASYTNQEEWDGSTWTTGGALATPFAVGGGAGSSASGVFAGGQDNTPGNLDTTQEVVKQAFVTTAAAWSSGGALNTGRLLYGGAGYKESGLVAGGFTSPPAARRDETEEYNGTTWSEQNNLGTARYENAHVGTQTAALFFGGYDTVASGKTEEYDGSSWSEQNDLGTARNTLAGAGTQTAGLAFGGSFPPSTPKALTEEYDGTSWSEQNDMSTARRYLMGFGIQTAAVACGGGFPSGVTTTEEYNGSSWTTGGALNTAKQRGAAGGIETDGLTFGGGVYPPSPHAVVEGYDGTAWSTRPSTANSKFNTGGGSTTTSTGSYMSGGRPGYVTSTEEFNAAFNTFPASTLTTS
jgi:hypothetical protein